MFMDKKVTSVGLGKSPETQGTALPGGAAANSNSSSSSSCRAGRPRSGHRGARMGGPAVSLPQKPALGPAPLQEPPGEPRARRPERSFPRLQWPRRSGVQRCEPGRGVHLPAGRLHRRELPGACEGASQSDRGLRAYLMVTVQCRKKTDCQAHRAGWHPNLPTCSQVPSHRTGVEPAPCRFFLLQQLGQLLCVERTEFRHISGGLCVTRPHLGDLELLLF